jgi:hypothetical protein
VFAPGKPLLPSLIFATKARAYTSSGDLCYGRLLALPRYIKPDWKGFARSNAAAYLVISDEDKNLHNIDLRDLPHKHFTRITRESLLKEKDQYS